MKNKNTKHKKIIKQLHFLASMLVHLDLKSSMKTRISHDIWQVSLPDILPLSRESILYTVFRIRIRILVIIIVFRSKIASRQFALWLIEVDLPGSDPLFHKWRIRILVIITVFRSKIASRQFALWLIEVGLPGIRFWFLGRIRIRKKKITDPKRCLYITDIIHP